MGLKLQDGCEFDVTFRFQQEGTARVVVSTSVG